MLQAFQLTKSQRKILRKNKNIRVELHEATVSDQHVSLYNQWHADMSERSGWKLQQTSIEDYAESFLFGGFSTLKELRYFRDDSLVGIGLIDLLPSAVSSVYFYHVPDWRPQSPGTFSMLCEIELAQSLHLNHLYLGYWIAECPSMAYKNRFSPSEVLDAMARRSGIAQLEASRQVSCSPFSSAVILRLFRSLVVFYQGNDPQETSKNNESEPV